MSEGGWRVWCDILFSFFNEDGFLFYILVFDYFGRYYNIR